MRRIATLVAEGLPPEEIFAVVIEEVGRLFGTDMTTSAGSRTSRPAFVARAGTRDAGSRTSRARGRSTNLDCGARLRSGRAVRVDQRLRRGLPHWPTCLLAWASSRRSRARSRWRVVSGARDRSRASKDLPADTEERLDEFTELVATAIANAESSPSSPRRADESSPHRTRRRRRIERDLHDGTQQRLVSLGLAVRAAEANLPPERDDLRAQLSGVATGLVAAVEDLQEISRGIHPAILSKGGLGPALQTLAHRSAIPVDLEIATDVRLAEPIEVAAYFVASEALANAAKHSQASRIDVSLEQRDGSLLLSVRDDGVGGADAGRGSGLIGLTDRVEALGGSIRVDESAGRRDADHGRVAGRARAATAGRSAGRCAQGFPLAGMRPTCDDGHP